jgi:hypothetical protein
MEQIFLSIAIISGSVATVSFWSMVRQLRKVGDYPQPPYFGWTIFKLQAVLNQHEKVFPHSKKIKVVHWSFVIGTVFMAMIPFANVFGR